VSVYAIGDVQGCFASLEALLVLLDYDPRHDRLWFAGDLVNRGPRSLDVLRWMKAQGESVLTVLGNHDLHLLACAAGVVSPRGRDTLDEVLNTVESTELVTWLRHRPLLHREGAWVLVHAGLLPEWTLKQAEALARELEAELQGDHWAELLRRWRRRSKRASWGERYDEAHTLNRRRVLGLDAFTRMRGVRSDGSMNLEFKGGLAALPAGTRPWYELRDEEGETVLFGHWAARGFGQGEGWVALDSACVWGGELTALRLEDGVVFSQPAVE